MTQSTGGLAPSHETADSQSTPEVAREEAAETARTAARAGGDVVDTAGDQARRVAKETTRQARNLVEESRTQLADQAREGQRKAVGSLHTLADQLDDMSERSDGSGMAPELVRQAADRTRTVATWLEKREPGDLLGEVRAFARRKPGVFLAGAAVAGVLAGRLTRGVVAAQSDSGSSGTGSNHQSRGQEPAGRHAVNPAFSDEPALPVPPQTPGYSMPPSGATVPPAGPAGGPMPPPPGGPMPPPPAGPMPPPPGGPMPPAGGPMPPPPGSVTR